FHATSTPEPYTLSLHDALPISFNTRYRLLSVYKTLTLLSPQGVTTARGILNIILEKNRTSSAKTVILQQYWMARKPKKLLKDWEDRKSTRLNSSHVKISYAVFC